MTHDPPAEYQDAIGQFGVVLVDGDTPVAWGWRIVRPVGESRFEALRASHAVACIAMGEWCIIATTLTAEEAEKRYGAVTNIERGPRGGYRSITYGKTTFRGDIMRRASAKFLVPNPDAWME